MIDCRLPASQCASIDLLLSASSYFLSVLVCSESHLGFAAANFSLRDAVL